MRPLTRLRRELDRAEVELLAAIEAVCRATPRDTTVHPINDEHGVWRVYRDVFLPALERKQELERQVRAEVHRIELESSKPRTAPKLDLVESLSRSRRGTGARPTPPRRQPRWEHPVIVDYSTGVPGASTPPNDPIGDEHHEQAD